MLDLFLRFTDFEAAAGALQGWEITYHDQRFSLALQGRTPAEKLAALRPCGQLRPSRVYARSLPTRGSILTRPNSPAGGA